MSLFVLRYLYRSEDIRIFPTYEFALEALAEMLAQDGFLSNYDLTEYTLDQENGEYMLAQEHNLFEIDELKDFLSESIESDGVSTIDSDPEDSVS